MMGDFDMVRISPDNSTTDKSIALLGVDDLNKFPVD
jgi:hypothetical protein